ncbi:NAD(P)H-hydrate dehydratase [Marinilactibacillus piezotolerans]|uniref:NAD(P)H-hydrate dehydratase n=1 Tax=Marinilactibacillus piezotolerans TaxID=258723 RepID=UPI0009AF962B|nr:NAD(P)H-hydrate dehydratase [Marinilactibacillus piezotolerans]
MKPIEKSLVEKAIPVRKENSYKGNFGKLLFVGGSAQMGGAIIMSSSAAVYSGAGLVTVASAPENVHALHARLPEAMFLNMYNLEALGNMVEKMDGIVMGPGLGRNEKATEVFKTVLTHLKKEQFLLIDGDAISIYKNEQMPHPNAQVVFTPHVGEWKTLSGLSKEEENEEDNRNKQKALDAIIVLKKGQSEVYFDDEVWQNIPGNPSMATGGMGDTLAGMIAGFMGQYEDQHLGILSAVYLHSDIANTLSNTHYVTLPTMIIEKIPETMHAYAQRQ